MNDDTLHSGRTVAHLLGVDGSTWGRWVAAGKAPSPDFDNGTTMKLYRHGDVVAFLDGLRVLAEAKAAA